MVRFFNHYLSSRVLLLTGLEAIALFGCVLLGFMLRFPGGGLELPRVEAGVFAFVTLMSMSAVGLYRVDGEPFRITAYRLLVALGMSLLVISAVFYVFPAAYVGRGVMGWSTLLALLSVLLIRALFFRMSGVGLPSRRVLVLGDGPQAAEVVSYLRQPHHRKSVVYAGNFVLPPEQEGNEVHVAEQREALLRRIERLRVSEVVIAIGERRGGALPLRQLLDCKLRGVSVVDLQSFFEREQGILRLDGMRPSWMIFSDGFNQGRLRDVVKRFFDIVVAASILLVALPLLLLAGLAIIVGSGFPVFYTQERVGEGGRRFKIYKLRTMARNAEADGKPRWASSQDSRVTRVGRMLRLARIDELPQLINVLKGDMSFVGPRPERPFFVEQLARQIPFYDVRHSMKPGITGWAQVRAPYGATLEESRQKLQYDLYYVKNHSLFLDLMVLLETLHVVLFGRGAR
jgi:sugar transferase (PEP-CTERM system associated)